MPSHNTYRLTWVSLTWDVGRLCWRVSKDTGEYGHSYAAGECVNWQYHFREKFDNFKQN